MRRICRTALGVAGLTLTLGATGCQTNIAGMTLPSGYYLDHRPQYFPVEPRFPLPRELSTQQAQYDASPIAAGPAGRLPAPVNAAK